MFRNFQKWYRDQIFEHAAISKDLWDHVLARLHFLHGLMPEEKTRLQRLVILFLHHKQISGVQGLTITEEMRITIALQACILILELDLDYYNNWVEVLVYPGQFIVDYDYIDENGIAHQLRKAVSGESWLAGPVILSWEDVVNSGSKTDCNVVIHEFAHKLDMMNEGANGCPILHANMSAQSWHDIFSSAYDNFCRLVERNEEAMIDSYAAESPAEFFAILSEVFFTMPIIIKRHFPSVYEQLALFYRQDTAKRWTK